MPFLESVSSSSTVCMYNKGSYFLMPVHLVAWNDVSSTSKNKTDIIFIILFFTIFIKRKFLKTPIKKRRNGFKKKLTILNLMKHQN
jgi:hypothetical protein